MSVKEQERPEWCERLHELADAVREAVLTAGWPVRAVAVVVSPTDVRLPEVMLGSRVETPAAEAAQSQATSCPSSAD